MSTKRPEHQAPPEIFYDQTEAQKYTQNTRIIEIQEKCTERALELLALPDDRPSYILDLGCGSGLSGETITENGHMWVGLDISPHMLDVALEREVEGDVIQADLGQGLPFRAGVFDGAVSISTLQWLCNADKSHHHPAKRLHKLFSTLYQCLARGSRAVFQFYPENDAQVELIISQAMRAGFTGGIVVDFPNSSKAKKVFLVLMSGGSGVLPQGLGAETQQQRTQDLVFRRERMRQAHKRGKITKIDWIAAKKERRRKQGKNVKADSKYTGRNRSNKFWKL